LEVVNAYAEKNQDCRQNPNYEVSRAFPGIQQAIEANKQIVAMEHMTQTHNSWIKEKMYSMFGDWTPTMFGSVVS
jgi:hypothetical protein